MLDDRGRDEIFVFGGFELNLRSGELRKRGLKLKLQPQPLAVLSLLVRHAGQLVSPDDLKRALWADDTFGARGTTARGTPWGVADRNTPDRCRPPCHGRDVQGRHCAEQIASQRAAPDSFGHVPARAGVGRECNLCGSEL